MKLEILILTQPSRAAMLEQLFAIIKPQVYSTKGDAGIRVRMHDPSISLGDNRNFLRNCSTAEYIVFVDDDDLLPPDYVETILPLLDGVDQIGYEVQTWCDYEKLGRTFHSLKHGDWHETGRNYYRNISHVNPIRAALARQIDMNGDFGEDCRWAQAMTEKGLVQTEHYIDRVMYHYLWRTNKRDYRDAQDPRRIKLYNEIVFPACKNCGAPRRTDNQLSCICKS